MPRKKEMNTCLNSRPSSSRPDESLKDRPKRWENPKNYEWVQNDKGKGKGKADKNKKKNNSNAKDKKKKKKNNKKGSSP